MSLDLILAYYGIRKIIDIRSRDFFIQSTVYESPRLLTFPDIMICSEGTVRITTSPKGGEDGAVNATVMNYDISKMAPEVLHNTTPCYFGDYTFSIISMNGVRIQGSRENVLRFRLQPKNASVPWEVYSAHFTSIQVIPFEANPYTKFLDLPTDRDHFPPSLANNLFTFPQNNSIMELHVSPKTTMTLRDDFWGLFGSYNDVLTHSVTSTVNLLPSANKSTVKVYMPSIYVVESQILITSVSDAFSAWGGASSVLWGAFIVFFGTGKMNAFGMIASRFLRQKTQRHLTRKYGYWSHESATPTSPVARNPPAASVHISPDSLSPEELPDQQGRFPLMASLESKAENGGDQALVLERLREQDERIRQQYSQIQQVDQDLGKLDKLLRKYYLEMDLASAEDPPAKASRGWRFWASRPDSSQEPDQSIPNIINISSIYRARKRDKVRRFLGLSLGLSHSKSKGPKNTMSRQLVNAGLAAQLWSRLLSEPTCLHSCIASSRLSGWYIANILPIHASALTIAAQDGKETTNTITTAALQMKSTLTEKELKWLAEMDENLTMTMQSSVWQFAYWKSSSSTPTRPLPRLLMLSLLRPFWIARLTAGCSHASFANPMTLRLWMPSCCRVLFTLTSLRLDS
ncbi:hypothetical protein BGZ72_006459 [Mortierella alpina]|nr:hypothetical protein BGZ72_006459 [Mortierella alpina]